MTPSPDPRETPERQEDRLRVHHGNDESDDWETAYANAETSTRPDSRSVKAQWFHRGWNAARLMVDSRRLDDIDAALTGLLAAVDNAGLEALADAEDGAEEPEWQTRLWDAADEARAALAQATEGAET